MSIERLSEHNRGILLRNFMTTRALSVYYPAEELVADFAYRAYFASTEPFLEHLEAVPTEYLHWTDEISYANAEQFQHQNPLPYLVQGLSRLYVHKPNDDRQMRSWRNDIPHPVSSHQFTLPFKVAMTEKGIVVPRHMQEEGQEIERELEAIGEKLRTQQRAIQEVLDNSSTFNQLWQRMTNPVDRQLMRNIQQDYQNYANGWRVDAALYDKDELKRTVFVGDEYKLLTDLLAKAQPRVEFDNGMFKLAVRTRQGTKYVPLMSATQADMG